MTKRAKIIAVIVVVAIIALLTYFGYKILSSNITEIDSKTSVGEIGDIVLSFFSVTVSLVLGIIVYFQSERINTLEASQYDVFLGVEKVDESTSFASEMIEISDNTENSSLGARLFETTHNDELKLYAHVQMSEQAQKTFLPLSFVTRNTLLITSLCINRIGIRVEIQEGDNQKSKLSKDLQISTAPIYRFLPNNSHFLLGINLHGVDKSTINKINISVDVIAEDQFGRKHSLKIDLDMIKIDKELRLISSKSKKF